MNPTPDPDILDTSEHMRIVAVFKRQRQALALVDDLKRQLVKAQAEADSADADAEHRALLRGHKGAS